MNKVYADARSALAGLLKDGMMIMAGGFGLCGIPETLILAIRDLGVKNLTVVSNNCGTDGKGLGILLDTRQIKKMISSYVGENKTFMQQYLAGELEIEFNPQGTLAERIRAGGAGIPAFFTRTGVGTQIAEGKKPTTSMVIAMSWSAAWLPTLRSFTLIAAIARAISFTARPRGILIPPMATAAKVTVAEVEQLVKPGDINPDHIVTPGIYVQRIVHVPNAPNTSSSAPCASGRAPTRRPAPAWKSKEEEESKSHALDPRADGGARRQGAARRILR